MGSSTCPVSSAACKMMCVVIHQEVHHVFDRRRLQGCRLPFKGTEVKGMMLTERLAALLPSLVINFQKESNRRCPNLRS